MRKLMKSLLNKLPNNYRPYKFWWLWIFIATIKTWVVTDLKTGIKLYIL
jgi:hypothetical protein